MAKTTIRQDGNTTYCTTEYFAADQSREELKSDYLTLLYALKSCAKGNCSGCFLNEYAIHNDIGGCQENLMKICEEQFKKLVDAKFQREV